MKVKAWKYAGLARRALGLSLFVCTAVHAGDAEDGALFRAIDRGEISRVGYFLEHGANPSARDKETGDTALIFALPREKFEIAALLLKSKEIDIDAENTHAQTALMVAA